MTKKAARFEMLPDGFLEIVFCAIIFTIHPWMIFSEGRAESPERPEGPDQKYFCRERRRLEKIFLPCGFSARKFRSYFWKNRWGTNHGQPPVDEALTSACGGYHVRAEINRKGAISP